MAPGDYASAGSGKLKLKGVKDSKVDKKKKKKSNGKSKDETGGGTEDASFQDRSVMLKNLADEDERLEKEERKKVGIVDKEGPGAGNEDLEEREVVKTEAEKRYEEQRRKRVCSVPEMVYTVSFTMLDSALLTWGFTA